MAASRAKAWFQRFDHAAIDLFIAGSCAPVALGFLRGTWGPILAGIVWTPAAVGAAPERPDRLRHARWSTAPYLAMGWAALVAAVPLARSMAGGGLAWLAAGGPCYPVDAVVFLFDGRRRVLPFVSHLLVIAGGACHFCARPWCARGRVPRARRMDCRRHDPPRSRFVG